MFLNNDDSWDFSEEVFFGPKRDKANEPPKDNFVASPSMPIVNEMDNPFNYTENAFDPSEEVFNHGDLFKLSVDQTEKAGSSYFISSSDTANQSVYSCQTLLENLRPKVNHNRSHEEIMKEIKDNLKKEQEEEEIRRKNAFIFKINSKDIWPNIFMKEEKPRTYQIFTPLDTEAIKQRKILENIAEDYKEKTKEENGNKAETAPDTEKERKIKPTKTQRKLCKDNIREKIKRKFFDTLRKNINQRLRLSGLNFEFSFLSDAFLSNAGIKFTKETIDKKYIDILLTEYKNKKDIIDKNMRYNARIIYTLLKFPFISERSGFNIIKDMTYRELFKQYLYSKECIEVTEEVKRKEEKIYYFKYVKTLFDLLRYMDE